MNIGELAKFRGGIATDTISEVTSASGVTIDGMLIKDGQTANANIANDGSADSPRGWAVASDADYTFTSTSPSRVRCSGMTAARTVTLPTTGIKAGAEFEVIVSGATETNYVVLNSSGANEVERIGGNGRIVVVALQDTPTSASHWEVSDLAEKGAIPYASLTFSAVGGGSITVDSGDLQKFLYSRTKHQIFFSIVVDAISVSGTVTSIRITIPSRFPALAEEQSTGIIFPNTSTLWEVGMITPVNNSRTIIFERYQAVAYPASTNLTYIRYNGYIPLY